MRIVDFKGILMAPKDTIFSVIEFADPAGPATVTGIWRKADEYPSITPPASTPVSFYAVSLNLPSWSDFGRKVNDIHRAYFTDKDIGIKTANTVAFQSNANHGSFFGIWNDNEIIGLILELKKQGEDYLHFLDGESIPSKPDLNS